MKKHPVLCGLFAATLLLSVPAYMFSEQFLDEFSNQFPENVYGTQLEVCSQLPLAGHYRNGKCQTAPSNYPLQNVCVTLDENLITFMKARSINSASPVSSVEGIAAGDNWCICSKDVHLAEKAGISLSVVQVATEKSALQHISLN